jgi:hypothetical protein
MDFSKEELLTALLQAIPYPDQMKNFDFSESNAIRFDWRDDRFRLNVSGNVERVKGMFLEGSNDAILLGALAKKQLYKNSFEKE